MLRNELLKYRRTHAAVVVILIPLISVVLGAGNYSANTHVLSNGWKSYLSQASLFYRLLFMTVGIAIIAASAWRHEHRGHNWAQLMTSPHGVITIFGIKTLSIVVLLAAMQCVFVLFAIIGGVVIQIPDTPPMALLLSTVLAIVPGAAVAAWQSLLSMVMRSFTLPIAISLLGTIVGFGIIASGAPQAVSFLVAPSMVTSVFFMGTTALATASALSASTITSYLGASVISATIAICAGGWVLRTTDVRL